MRHLPLVLLALSTTGCIENRAEIRHDPSADPGYAWIDGRETPGSGVAPSTSREGHKPQEIVGDAWRVATRRPTYAEWLTCDRVQRRDWPRPLPLQAWQARGSWPLPVRPGPVPRRWIRLADVGAPATLPEFQQLQRATVQAQSPIPWWQWFPADIPASLIPVDFTSTGIETVRYEPVIPLTQDALRQQAAEAGYHTMTSHP
jgi:hypothetical protein